MNESSKPVSDGIGEQNTSRLLAQAYRPELPDAAFAQRVKEAMLAARVPETYSPWASRHGRPLMVAAAAALALAGGLMLAALSSREPGFRRDGATVWIDGKPYTPAGTGVLPPEGDGAAGAATGGTAGMTARAPATRPVIEVAQIGQTITTEAGQRRRVGLADGSVLYINQKTSLRIDGPRRVTLNSGEAYFEVSPRQGVASVKDPTFVVKTPGRQVAALGTHFNVCVRKTGTGVMVTQGKVDVNGTSVWSGEELPPENEGTGVVDAPRSSIVLNWIQDLVTAAQTPLVPSSDYQGGALIAIDPWGQESKLALRNYTVDVYIEDGFARTTIDQTYFNYENVRLEGTFYFPLPADASLSRLAMYVDDTLMEGGMCEREQAREVYETILYQRRDPALLEWVDGTTFKMRIFPIEARQEKRIILSYTQKLDSLYGQAKYRFPAGHTMNLVRDWSFKAVVKNGGNLPWTSDSHPLAGNPQGGDLVVNFADHQVKPDHDVVLNLGNLSSARDAGPARFTSASFEGQNYLMVRAVPPLQGAAKHQRRDWVFLFESSGARDPLLARAQVEIIRTILANAEHEDTFAIVTAGARASTMGAAVKATPENVQSAMGYLEQTHLVGALDLGQALDATSPFISNAANPYLVHLGAGNSVLGDRAPDQLVKRIPARAKYVGIGVGKSWSRQFMKAAAAATGGYFTQINPDEAVTWRAFDLLATLNTPRLLNVQVSDPSGTMRFLSFDDALAQGEELCAIARYPSGAAPAEVQLSGMLDGVPFRQTMPVVEVAGNAGYLPRMWAKLEIDRLLAEGSEGNKAAVIALSKAMYVMSPYTSLLVLENEAMYKQFNVDRGRKDHWAMYAAPEKIKVVYEPDPLRPSTQPLVGGQRFSAEQALATILIRIAPQPLYWPNQQRYYYGSVATAWDLYNGVDQEQFGMDWGFEDGLATNWSRYHDSWQDAGGKRMSRWAQQNEGKEGNSLLPAQFVGGKARLGAASGPMGGGGGGGGRSGLAASSARGVRATKPGLARSVDFLQENGKQLSADSLLLFRSALKRSETRDFSEQAAAYQKNLLSLVDGRFDMDRLAKSKFGKDSINSEIDYFSSYSLSSGYRSLMYQRPYFNNNWRVFGDLLQYAPGMNTTDADIQAVLESETVADPAAAPGSVDAQARALIDRARAAGWQTATISQGQRLPAFQVTFDGQGRYRYERIVSEGLQETVICDGKTLLHLYPELGVGARRAVSRFHRESFASVIPWALPSADDLAHGCNLTTAADGSVMIVPTGAEQRKDADGKAVPYGGVRLVFAEDGRLAERRWLEMPTGKTLYRELYSASGTARGLDDQEKQTSSIDLALKPAAEPPLAADTKNLVMLALPYRDRAHLLRTNSLVDDNTFNWSEENALAVIAADLYSNSNEAMRIIGARFFARGDRRIGLYTLLLSSQYDIAPDTTLNVANNVNVAFNPVADHPGSALARYCVDQWKIQQQNYNATDISTGGGKDFVSRLATIRYAMLRLQRVSQVGGTTEERAAAQQRALETARTTNEPMFGWALLTMCINYGSGNYSDYYPSLAQTAKSMDTVPGLSYAARYEEARALHQSGTEPNRALAKAKFLALYGETLDSGGLPLIDYDFHSAMRYGTDDWMKLMRETAATVRAKYGRVAAIYHAWQCYQLSDQALAEELFSAALTDVPATERVATLLAAVDYLQSAGQYPRAAQVLQPLLDDPKLNQSPTLWYLASQLAYNRGMTAQGLGYQERAMDLEFANMPAIVNLQYLREAYSQAMGQYLRLASAIATLRQAPSNDMITRVIRTADRWRAIDPDKTAACQSAAQIFQAMNVPELAWDYMTTPLAEKSNEAQPWVNLAQMLRQQGDFPLADRAYATAFEVEPTNAQTLWDRAMLQQQMQHLVEARKLYQQLADGKWEPRFLWLQTQAKNYVQSH